MKFFSLSLVFLFINLVRFPLGKSISTGIKINIVNVQGVDATKFLGVFIDD